MPPRQGNLFRREQQLPDGFTYRRDFVTPDEEQVLLREIEALSFGEVRMHGVAARRRVAQFGWSYSFDSQRLREATEVPAFLESLRERAAPLAGVTPAALSEALVTEYPPGAPIGWHRDAPVFGTIVGVSLAAPCRFLLRHVSDGRRVEVALESRSAYVLAGEARRDWQHHIPPVKLLRYSITFRTLRRDPA